MLAAIKTQPFHPFSIRMANDRLCHVDHPELALMASNGWAVTVVDAGGVFRVVALTMMISIEDRPATT